MTARSQSVPRKIKRTIQEEADSQSRNTLKYQFYRNIIHPTILKLKNEIDKLNYSTWLTRLDLEEENIKIVLIKNLFISLKNKVPYCVFENFPPDDLSELNLHLEDSNAMDVLKNLQNYTNELQAKKVVLQEARFKRTAAVATDLRSYTSTKTSSRLIQLFYAQSDFPIRLWDNPSSIILPISNTDHNQWDLYMNHFNMLTKNKDTDGNHQNGCEILKVEQVPKEVTINFRWHPSSLLLNSNDRPKRSACFLESDQDIANQPSTQELIDNAAFDIVYEKSFPGHKILIPRIYCTLLMPDPKYVFTMTNVKVVYNKISHIAYISYKQKSQCKKRNVKVPDNCYIQQNSSSENNCLKTDDSKSICILPFKKCYPCPEIVADTPKRSQKICNTNSTTQPGTNSVGTRNDSGCIQSNETHHSCDKTFACSRSENKSLVREEKKNLTKCDLSMSSKKQPNNSLCCSSQNHTNSKQYNLNNNNQSQAHISQTSNVYNSALDDSSNYELSMNSVKSSPNKNASRNHTDSEQCNSNNNINNHSLAHISQTSNVFNDSLDDSSNYDWTMSNVESSPDKSVTPDWKCASNNSNSVHTDRKCNQLSCIESTNQNHQIPEHENRRSHCNDTNRSRLTQSQNAEGINETPRKHNRRTCSSNSRQRNISCNLNQTKQQLRSNDKEKQCHMNQNNSCPTCSEHQQNNYLNTPATNNNKRSLPATSNNFLNRNETITRPRFDENFDPNISSYSTFSNRNNHSGEQNDKMGRKTSSCHSLPNNNNQNIRSDESSQFSDWSEEIDFRPMHPTNCSNSSYIMMSNVRSSFSLDSFDKDNNRINRPLSVRNNNLDMGTCGCQTDNIQDNRNIINSTMMDISSVREHQTSYDLLQQDISMPHMKESSLMSLPSVDFQDLENITMPNNSYNPINSDNMSMDNYSDLRNTSMPNNSLEELSNNNNVNIC